PAHLPALRHSLQQGQARSQPAAQLLLRALSAALRLNAAGLVQPESRRAQELGAPHPQVVGIAIEDLAVEPGMAMGARAEGGHQVHDRDSVLRGNPLDDRAVAGLTPDHDVTTDATTVQSRPETGPGVEVELRRV